MSASDWFLVDDQQVGGAGVGRGALQGEGEGAGLLVLRHKYKEGTVM
jgi:hypothetical protein